VDPKTWSGSLPNQWGTAPMVRVGRSRWFNLLWLVPLGLAFLVVGVAAAKALRELPSVQAFVERYPGTIPPPNGQEGIPAWVGWQHFLNLFLMTFIIRSAVQILADHHRLYWTRHSTRPGLDRHPRPAALHRAGALVAPCARSSTCATTSRCWPTT